MVGAVETVTEVEGKAGVEGGGEGDMVECWGVL